MQLSRVSKLNLSSTKTYVIFSLFTGFLFLWFLFGYTSRISQSKFYDFINYFIFFSVGPILAWLTYKFFEKRSNNKSKLMQWVLAVQAFLVLLILGLIWIPYKELNIIWNVPIWMYLFVTCFCIGFSKIFHEKQLWLFDYFSKGVIFFLLPILPGLVFISAITFSPEIREELTRLLQSTRFVFGVGVGAVATIVALVCLRLLSSSEKSTYRKLNILKWVIAIIVVGFAILLLLDSRLYFDWIHYGTYIGPANAVLQGRVPMVEAFSQYGILNYLVYSLAFILAPYPSMKVAAVVSISVQILTYVCYIYLATRLCRSKLFAMFFSLLMIYAMDYLMPYSMSAYPNFSGMRFFPIALICAALATIPLSRRFTFISVLALSIGLLWSFESAVCSLAAYLMYLIILDARLCKFRSLSLLLIITLCVYGILTVYTLVFSGSLPRFDLYLHLVFGYVNEGAYWAGQWLKPLNPKLLVWVPLTILYFGIVALAFRFIVERRFSNEMLADELLIARVSSVATCGIILLGLFVGRSLWIYLLIVTPIGLMLYTILTTIVWERENKAWDVRVALGVPFVLLVSISSGLVCNIIFESDINKKLTNDHTAGYHWVTQGNTGFLNAWRQVKIQDADYEIGMSFPWKPDRMKECEVFVKRWFEDQREILIFAPEGQSILMRNKKVHLFPTSYSISEQGDPIVSKYITNANVNMVLGDKLIVTNNIYALNPLEYSMLCRISKDWDIVPIDVGKFVTVYELKRGAKRRYHNRLILPYPVIGVAASSAPFHIYSAEKAGNPWEEMFWSTAKKHAPFTAWLQLDLGKVQKVSKLEIVPYWPSVDCFPSHFIVLVSEDGLRWNKVAEEKKFSPDWKDYQKKASPGYIVELGLRHIRWIRVEANVPFSPSQGGYILQISSVLAFGR